MYSKFTPCLCVYCRLVDELVKGGVEVDVVIGINLSGLSTGSNTKRSITQSLGSTRSLELSLRVPTDVDYGGATESVYT